MRPMRTRQIDAALGDEQSGGGASFTETPFTRHGRAARCGRRIRRAGRCRGHAAGQDERGAGGADRPDSGTNLPSARHSLLKGELRGRTPQSPAGRQPPGREPWERRHKRQSRWQNDDLAVYARAQTPALRNTNRALTCALRNTWTGCGGRRSGTLHCDRDQRQDADAAQQLDGLDKVGKVTMMDANAVKHITNRHAGGDGERRRHHEEQRGRSGAAYVLNHLTMRIWQRESG